MIKLVRKFLDRYFPLPPQEEPELDVELIAKVLATLLTSVLSPVQWELRGDPETACRLNQVRVVGTLEGLEIVVEIVHTDTGQEITLDLQEFLHAFAPTYDAPEKMLH